MSDSEAWIIASGFALSGAFRALATAIAPREAMQFYFNVNESWRWDLVVPRIRGIVAYAFNGATVDR
jgi:hypothetical protein